jgi:hypothetical protein
MATEAEPLYFERQHVRQIWFWAFMLFVFFFPVLINKLTSAVVPRDSAAALVTERYVLIPMTITLAIAILVYIMHLDIRVTRKGLSLQFFPFHLKPRALDLDKTISIEAVTYAPIGEYGGWGLRYVKNGRAYNVGGNRGVRIDYENGKHVLLGSERAEELEEALQRWCRERGKL